jgi:hypothetical protein
MHGECPFCAFRQIDFTCSLTVAARRRADVAAVYSPAPLTVFGMNNDVQQRCIACRLGRSRLAVTCLLSALVAAAELQRSAQFIGSAALCLFVARFCILLVVYPGRPVPS